ncbi:MarR family transcriptional regulator [Micromonospora sp. 4G57]|uniref:MarR family transcriptional regulator n=1 Tax=Micromonospora sicca TaxID=2202420 RepID=A0ABU5JN33_9ACTN|nr:MULTISPECIES: MarR family transcriptional regulator [unclassified Micromonospora]MDZ5447270.1 MarR family transcriptional regulator [Micromonospora sp. 4G57]MDZ5493966.1 MarR family transcriptional regulator [Micromonospora sp. 4G53]
MTDTPQHVPAHTMFQVLAALGELGEATAAAVAEHAGLGYSTATAKLRAWEQIGQVEKLHTDGNRTLWRLTDTGRTTTTTGQADPPSREAVTDSPPDELERSAPDTAGPPQQDGERIVPPNGHTDDEATTPSTGTPTSPDAATPGRADEEQPPSAEADHQDQQASATGDEVEAEVDADVGSEAASTAPDRRSKGSLRGAVLDILEAHPDRQYKTGELCRLIDAANAGSGAKKASGGAVYNAAVKLVAAGTAVQTVEKPATFQYAPTTGSR